MAKFGEQPLAKQQTLALRGFLERRRYDVGLRVGMSPQARWAANMLLSDDVRMLRECGWSTNAISRALHVSPERIAEAEQ